MTEEKGLDPLVADKIGEYVKQKGFAVIFFFFSLALIAINQAAQNCLNN
jgi:hypothetical protein